MEHYKYQYHSTFRDLKWNSFLFVTIKSDHDKLVCFITPRIPGTEHLIDLALLLDVDQLRLLVPAAEVPVSNSEHCFPR